MSDPETLPAPSVRDAPAFDFYPERWLVGVAGMSDAEQLSYLRLLCHQWLLGDAGLPPDAPALKRLAGKGVTPAVLAKLPQNADGRRRNARLEIVRKEQRERIAKKSEQRRVAAQKRWHSGPAPAPPPSATLLRGPAPDDLNAEDMRPQCGNDAGDMRPHCGSICGEDAAGMPTTHRPPPTSHPIVPDSIHPRGQAQVQSHERVRPTLEQARAIAPEIGITPDQAESWWLAREASQWLRSSNGALMPVGDNWRADARTFTQNALQRRQPRHAGPRQAAVRCDSANAPGRYA
ncbi:hypothetical protein [Prosthecobacter sp.]|uniref:hypothetical protein n=1 Tax=Prosthecobacter sp. TaxID=1965333 RepID=UPI003783D59C